MYRFNDLREMESDDLPGWECVNGKNVLVQGL
jgi:hypothetical protein